MVGGVCWAGNEYSTRAQFADPHGREHRDTDEERYNYDLAVH